MIDGNWGFGYVVNDRAMRYTIEKAKKQNVAAATVLRQSHVGRLASYPLVAAAEGMIAMTTADSGRSPKAVAPYGGAKARLGTNPISFAIPSNLEGPFVFDMATSAAAAGKINVATARGEQVPTGWLIDAEGRPSTDPKVLRAGGAHPLALGGTRKVMQRDWPSRRSWRSTVRAADRPWFRYRSAGPAQRRLLHGGVQCLGVPRIAEAFKQEVTDFYTLPERHAQRRKGFTEGHDSTRAKLRSAKSRTGARTVYRSRTRPGSV